MSETRVRFAPSPTGKLHLGNVRTAVINWLLAKSRGGVFMLRMDDTDSERSTDAFAQAIKRDLTWLGLEWTEFEQQSTRMARYDEVAEQLKASGRLYPCYETSVELDLMRKSLLQRGKPPIYDRGALKLTDEQKAAYEAEGRKPHWRFKLDAGEIAWEDYVRGAVSFDAENISDPVLIREDGRPLYTLSSVVDDMDFAITDIVRGEDHTTNTATQVQLFEAIGASLIPRFAHLPLVTDANGEKLSKRIGSLAVEQMREDHEFEPLAVNIFLAKLGTPDGALPLPSLDALAAEFDITRYGRAAPKLDTDELGVLNGKLVHELGFDAVSERLPGMTAALWDVVKGNLDKVSDAALWVDVVVGNFTPVVADDDVEFINEAKALLPAAPWDESSWGAWTSAVKEATGRKGKQLFMPLRLAMTGQARGPEMAQLMPLLKHG